MFEDLRCNIWGHVDFYNSNHVETETYKTIRDLIPIIPTSVVVPRNIYTPNIKAIQIVAEGSCLKTKFYFIEDLKFDAARNGKLVIAGKQNRRSCWNLVMNHKILLWNIRSNVVVKHKL